MNDSYGSSFGRMFGYVKDDDYRRWDSLRAQNQKRMGAIRQGLSSFSQAMYEIRGRELDAKIQATERVVAQEKFEESHHKEVHTHKDPLTGATVSTTQWELSDSREELPEDPEIDTGLEL